MRTRLNFLSLYELYSIKKKILLLLLFGAIALSLLAPIASNDYLPAAMDFRDHVSAIVEAKMALASGQFPIRTIPSSANISGNPYFQFYSPLPYTVAAFIDTIGNFQNAFFVLKLVICLALIFAGCFMFRFITLLTKSEHIGLLASVAYLFSPYLLININTRGDFTEAIAQCLIPFTLYYSYKVFCERLTFFSIALNIVAWSILALTHILTFIYFSFFLGLFFLFLTINNISKFNRLILLGIIYVYACLIDMWYLQPMYFLIDSLNMKSQLSGSFKNASLTHLSTLLSPNAFDSEHAFPICLSIGWVFLFAIVTNIISFFQKEKNNIKLKIIALLLMFTVIAAICSPFNFWIYLPAPLQSIQFPYRLLTQTMWIGSLLFALSLLAVFRKVDVRHVAIGICIIGLCNHSWIATNNTESLSTQKIMEAHDILAKHAYLMNTIHVLQTKEPISHAETSLLDTEGFLKLNQPIFLSSQAFNDETHQHIILTGQLSTTPSHPLNLAFEINGAMTYKTITEKKFTWDIPIGSLIHDRNELLIGRFTLDNPNFLLYLPIKIDSIRFPNLKIEPLLTALSIRPFCADNKNSLVCQLHLSEPSFIQLPFYYYPQLLSVQINHHYSSYVPSIDSKNNLLAGLKLAAGDYTIQIQFNGTRWANWVSTFSAALLSILLIGYLLALLIRHERIKRYFQFQHGVT